MTDPSFALSVDRDWIQKLLFSHSSNPNDGRALVVAPMVDQSDYPFRILCRRYGSNLAYTPMIHSGLLTRSDRYRAQFLPTERPANDRPLIAQLCGHDPLVLERAARMLLPFVDAIDLNCGCPQGIAKRGFYGAFLLEDEATLLKCVRHLTTTLPKPVCVKVRLLYHPNDRSIDAPASLRLYRRLVDAGIHLLAVHGRTRHQLHVHTGAADWTVIRQVVQEFGHKIPIFANGNISSRDDVQRCLEETGVDGVMSSEAILEYPALFHDARIGRIQLAKEYLQLARQYPPQIRGQGSGIKCLKAHIHRILHPDLEDTGDHILRQQVAQAADWQTLWDIVCQVEQIHQQQGHKVEEETLCWYMRHRMTVADAHGNELTSLQLKLLHDQGAISNKHNEESPEEEDGLEEPATCLFSVNGGEDVGDY